MRSDTRARVLHGEKGPMNTGTVGRRSDVEPAAATLQTAFAPLHKTAFGVAIGVAAALTVFLATAVHLLRNPDPPFPLHLLSQYLTGYTVSWPGALIGAAWAGFAGFVAGWFLAFSKNALTAILLFIVRTRAELMQSRDILDHL